MTSSVASCVHDHVQDDMRTFIRITRNLIYRHCTITTNNNQPEEAYIVTSRSLNPFTVNPLRNNQPLQGCCLTGARSPEVPKLRVRATKVLCKEPEWAPKDRVFIPN